MTSQAGPARLFALRPTLAFRVTVKLLPDLHSFAPYGLSLIPGRRSCTDYPNRIATLKTQFHDCNVFLQ